MSPDTPAVLWATTVIVTNGLMLFTSWLRICWQVQQERARHQALIAMAEALPEGGQIRENRSDGTWILLAVTRNGQGYHG